MSFTDGFSATVPQVPLFMRDPNSGNDASNLGIDDIFDEFLFSNDQQRDLVKNKKNLMKDEKGDFEDRDDDDDYDDYSLDGDNDGDDGNDSQGKKKKRQRGQQQRYMTEEQRIERR